MEDTRYAPLPASTSRLNSILSTTSHKSGRRQTRQCQLRALMAIITLFVAALGMIILWSDVFPKQFGVASLRTDHPSNLTSTKSRSRLGEAIELQLDGDEVSEQPESCSPAAIEAVSNPKFWLVRRE